MTNSLEQNTKQQSTKQQSSDTSTFPAALFRRWLHSGEEDAGGIEVYRPEGFSFPPSHGRDGFEVRADGRFVQEDIGPDDGVVRIPGHWVQVASRRLAVRFTDPDRAGFGLEIVDLDDTVLRVHRITRHAGPAVATSAADPGVVSAFLAKPMPSALRLVDFDRARVITLKTFPVRHVLEVSGVKPIANMVVELMPLVYVRQPEFWEIEVVGALPDIGLPAEAPYTVSIPLDGTLGRYGVEVVGANQRQRFDLFCDMAAS